jgi:hypothetical protein
MKSSEIIEEIASWYATWKILILWEYIQGRA